MSTRSRWLGIVLAFWSCPALAQQISGGKDEPLAARYDRAAQLMIAPASSKVRNESVVPHWIGTTDRFWYLRQTATGSEFVVVDAATGGRSAAFDAAGIASSLTRALKRPVSPQALPFSDFSYSADGASIEFVVGNDRYRCSVDRSICQTTPVAPPGMLVSPDGKRGISMRDGNLYLHDLGSGKQYALTSDGSADKGWGIIPEPSDYRALRRAPSVPRMPHWTYWSPDSRRLFTSFTDQSYVTPYPYLDYAPADGSGRPVVRSIKLNMVGEKPALTKFFVFDVEGGSRREVSLDSTKIESSAVAAHWLEWTTDSSHLRLFVRAADQLAALLYDIDASTGSARLVIRDPGRHPALLNAGGYGAANVAVVDGGRSAIWSSQRSGYPHLYLYDIASGRQLRQLTTGPWMVRDLLRTDDRLKRVFFSAAGREPGNPYFRSIYSVGYDGRNMRRLTPEAEDKPVINPRSGGPGFDGGRPYDPISPSGRYIVYSYSGVAKPAVTIVRRSDEPGPPHVVERADASALLAAGYRPPSEFVAKAADGKTDLYGVIYRPSDYDPAKRYPVMLAQYNSPDVIVTPRNFGSGYGLVHDNSTPAAEAELGMIVVVVDPRGTPFRGAIFGTPGPSFIDDMGLTDQIAVIREIATRDPSLDLSRVAVAGASYGAWTSLRALIKHNDFFSVGVAWAPVGSFATLYDLPLLTSPLGSARYAGDRTVYATAAERPLNWSAGDSIAQVGEMRGRLLMGTGGLDENVVPGSQLQFLEAAAEAGKDVEQIFVPRATHGPLPAWPYVVKRTWDFLARTLLNQTPPTDYTFPPGTIPNAPPRRSATSPAG